MRPLIEKVTYVGSFLLVLGTLCLGGCQDKVTVADIKGACDAFDAPAQPVIGKRKVDQKWIDRAVEAGVSACGWSRPKAQEIVNRAVGS